MSKKEKEITKLTVNIREGEDFNRALRKFTKLVQESGKLKTIKEKQTFLSNVDKRRESEKSARGKWLKYLSKTTPKKR